MPRIEATVAINDAFSKTLDKLTGGLQRGQMAMSRLKGIMNGGNDFGQAASKSSGMFKSMTGGVVVGNLISKGMGLASSGISSMLSELNEASTSWQTFEGNLRQLGRSPAQIASAKKDMQQFAQQTIYSASDMSSTYAQLAAVGVKNTGQLVKGFGGLAAASDNPAQAMKTLSEQATQMAAKPKAQWQDFKLMLEQSPAGMAAVAKTMGTDLTGLIQKIQAGEVSSKSLLNAIAKTGTNANFSKMATQYKTVGQAMDGLKETLANKLQPAFDKVGQVGIKAVSSITDKLGDMDFSQIGDNLANGLQTAIDIVGPIIEKLGQGFQDFMKGFEDSGALDTIGKMFKDIADSAKRLTDSMDAGGSKNSIFSQLGSLSGSALSTAANAISGIADAIGDLDPNSLTLLAGAFVTLKMGTKGLVLTAVVASLMLLNKLSPGTMKAVAKGITAIAMAVMLFRGIHKGAQAISDIADAFDRLKGLKNFKMPQTKSVDPTAGAKPGKILQNAGACMKLGAALLMVGGAVTLVAIGFKLIADTATQLASSGGAAIAVFFGMVAAIAALAVVVKLLGPGMLEASLGFTAFAVALLLIGAAIFVATAGIALLATQLPLISQYGTSAAVGLLALAGAIAVFGIAAIVGAVGLIVLGAALIVVALGFTVAAVGALLLGVALMVLGVGAMVAAAGVILLGVGLTLVAALSMVAAVGLLLMGVALMMIMVSAMIAAVGLMLLGVALVLVGPLSMIAAVGLLLMGVALVVVSAGLMLVAAGLMLVATSMMMLVTVVSTIISAFARLISSITSKMAQVASTVRTGVSNAVNAVKGFVGDMVSAGADLIRGLINGIESMVGSAVAAAKSVGSKIAGAVKSFFHIGSPSRLMMQYGRWIDQGLINGLNRDGDKAGDTALGIAQNISDNMAVSAPSIGTPGDDLASGFDRALMSILGVSNAMNSLNGTSANVGIFGAATGSIGGGINSTVGSSSITPGSLTTSNNANTSNSQNNQVNIQSGAIVVQSTGNAQVDADALLEAIEDKVIEAESKSLS